ncbi:MAG: SseB family protein [Nesterenkonia sp.]
MSENRLPAHIANLLERQQRSDSGAPADSAGIAWSGRDLSGDANPLHTFDGDDGHTTAPVAAARRRLITGESDEAQFVASLAGQRLFAPVLATGTGDAENGDKEADISLVSLTAPDGRRAMPVFTSVQALTGWHRQARPVAAEAERVMLAALAEDAELVVLDPGTPQAPAELTYVIRRPAVEALAQGQLWTPSYLDDEVVQALAPIPDQCPGVAQLVVKPHPGIITQTASGARVLGGGHGPELSLGVVVEPGTDAVGQRLALAAVEAAAADVQALRQRADSLHIELVEQPR